MGSVVDGSNLETFTYEIGKGAGDKGAATRGTCSCGAGRRDISTVRLLVSVGHPHQLSSTLSCAVLPSSVHQLRVKPLAVLLTRPRLELRNQRVQLSQRRTRVFQVAELPIHRRHVVTKLSAGR